LKLLVLVIASLLSLSALGEEADTSRSDNIKRFNESQRCHKSAIAEGHKKKAVRCAQSSLEAGENLFEPDSKNIAGLTYNYGSALLSRGYDSGKRIQKVLSEALRLYESLYGENSLELVDLLLDLGHANNLSTNATGVKRSSYSRALEILASNYGNSSLEYAEAQLAISIEILGRARTSGQVSFSNKHAKGALEIFLQELGPTSVGATLASFQLGKHKMLREKYRSAIPFLNNALANPSVAQYAHGFLIRAYEETGQGASAGFHAQELGKLVSGQEDMNYIPVYVPQPDYPRGAQRSGTNGYVIIELTVSREGLAIDPIVIEEMPASKGFAKAALKAAKKLRYVPRFVDGEAVEVPGVLYKFTFKMAR
jgi:TonB family protein